MQEIGIPGEYGPHSVRGAAASAAHGRGLEVDAILRTGGWSTESTFRKHYNCPVLSEEPSFSNVILGN